MPFYLYVGQAVPLNKILNFKLIIKKQEKFMEKNEKNIDSEFLQVKLNIQNENFGFDTEKMISCKKCSRKSPPNRTKCLYCGNEFDQSQLNSDLIKPNLRNLESWENGFNLIYLPTGKKFLDEEIREISDLLNAERGCFEQIVENNEIIPFARIESKAEAELVRERFIKKGFEIEIVSDEDLNLKISNKRLRKVEFVNDKICLTLFNSNEIISILLEDLVLIVIGSVFEKKLESVEKYNKSKENKPISIDETGRDEKIIDLYTKQETIGYRILMNGFDFSGLGNEMSILASENIMKMFEKLKKTASRAKVSETYDIKRALIGKVWQIEEINDSQGMDKKGIGNFNLKKTVKNSNLSQFTKYSRLQRFFYEKK